MLLPMQSEELPADITENIQTSRSTFWSFTDQDYALLFTSFFKLLLGIQDIS